jgi:ribosomal protein RSM22 (predicted rRNA methylase)
MTNANEKIKTPVNQPQQYDKVVQEGIENSLPDMKKYVLKINVVKREKLLSKILHTEEREPDALEKITDDQGQTFILHIEFQSNDDSDMVYRMHEYLAMLLRKYKLPVKQYVIYMGEKKSSMRDRLQLEMLDFRYNLINISSIDYKTFLQSENPDLNLFAMLGDFGKDSPATALKRIVEDTVQNTHGELEKERRKNQLRMLAQLRNFTLEDIDIMKHVIIPFEKEKDIFYRVGRHEGYEAGQHEGEANKSYKVVKTLIVKMGLSDEQAADIGDVPVAFVRKVRAELKRKK